ncbi:MAG: D-alanyl-D-alanine carboxypeptidase [Oscillospiraceae bacterium]|nr:D-alanyl-D-alanine carboxypeptidase [Oscillospiraceae bacterium]
MKRLLTFLLVFLFCLPVVFANVPPETVSPHVILMERDSGKILFEKDSHSKHPPASVTKVMTLLLVMEAIDSGKIALTDTVTVSDHAASMGGSQVFLSPGEQMSVNDMLKATVIASGNDSAVALAEHIAGSEEGFVSLMNEKAKYLGMNDTSFKNCTGLDADGHLTSAHDIAIMSKELLKHSKIKEYTTIWMDSLRDGAFQLANTNKLIRTYKGITGLKTGSTSNAKFCLSASAERDGMELIAVIMAAPSSKERFSDATKLLDFGFANYAVYRPEGLALDTLPVKLGDKPEVSLSLEISGSVLIEKNKIQGIESKISIPTEINAPVEKGQKIGVMTLFSDNELLMEIPIVADESIKKLSVYDIFSLFLDRIFMK